MNLRQVPSSLRSFGFRLGRNLAGVVPGGRIDAFGIGDNKISSILVINLDRQPKRWRRILRELGRFKTSEGASLKVISRRFAAVDAREGRAVAATVDVDRHYCIGDQLFVQPDIRLEECFGVDEPVKMTRQEVAIARSHIEVWKTIVAGPHKYVLILEDDIWFRPGAASAINRAWRAALKRYRSEGDLNLLYLSYEDAGGTAERSDTCEVLFRPLRGLWFLSGYVLSQKGAASLLKAMPVVGPVDTWINYRFEKIHPLALSSPVVLQREDNISTNSYSILPYLARAGIVDSASDPAPPERAIVDPVFGWTAESDRESLAMALSILGLRVRVFDDDQVEVQIDQLPTLFEEFDVILNAPLASAALARVAANKSSRFILEDGMRELIGLKQQILPPSQTLLISGETGFWKPICDILNLTVPIQSFPAGAHRDCKVFRDGRAQKTISTRTSPDLMNGIFDDSPWLLPLRNAWKSVSVDELPITTEVSRTVFSEMTSPNKLFVPLVETFPGNQASFALDGIHYNQDGIRIVLSKETTGARPYRSGAFASSTAFEYGRFEADIKAASGAGLITGFFLHRSNPKQEIDIEISGNDPRKMLMNVYFNPGDDGDVMEYGYRGSPCAIDLGFDATEDFHHYSIEWQPGHISWSVDGRIVHQRVSWEPTPIPYLPMRLYGNLWAPRSEELAGRLENNTLPANAVFRNVSIREN